MDLVVPQLTLARTQARGPDQQDVDITVGIPVPAGPRAVQRGGDRRNQPGQYLGAQRARKLFLRAQKGRDRRICSIGQIAMPLAVMSANTRYCRRWIIDSLAGRCAEVGPSLDDRALGRVNCRPCGRWSPGGKTAEIAALVEPLTHLYSGVGVHRLCVTCRHPWS